VNCYLFYRGIVTDLTAHRIGGCYSGASGGVRSAETEGNLSLITQRNFARRLRRAH
jgi:hypothetical protein